MASSSLRSSAVTPRRTSTAVLESGRLLDQMSILARALLRVAQPSSCGALRNAKLIRNDHPAPPMPTAIHQVGAEGGKATVESTLRGHRANLVTVRGVLGARGGRALGPPLLDCEHKTAFIAFQPFLCPGGAVAELSGDVARGATGGTPGFPVRGEVKIPTALGQRLFVASPHNLATLVGFAARPPFDAAQRSA